MKRNIRINPKSLLSMAIASSMALTQFPIVDVYANDSLIMEEQFDNILTGEKPEGFLISEETGSVRVSEEPNELDKSLLLEDNGDKNTKIVKNFDEQKNKMSFVIDFMQPELGSTSKVVRLMDKNGDVAVHIETRSGGIISYKLSDDSYVELMPYEKGVWYTIQINADIEKQNADIFVNGKMLGEDIPFYSKVDEISQFDSFTPGSGVKSHYVDNLKIYNEEVIPEISDKAKNGKVEVEEDIQPEEILPPAEITEPEEIVTITPEVPVATDKIVLEAEDAELEGVIIDTKHTGYSGTGFTDYNPNVPGGTITWKVNIPVEGEYDLTFRYGHGGSDERPAEIKVNDEVIEQALAFDPTGEWNNWQTTSCKAHLVAGENIIVATGVGASGGANIDNLVIEPTNAIVFEAEDAELEGVIIDTKHTGYTGTGFTDYNPNSPGGTITWKVSVPSDSQYKLTFRYGHGGSDERPAEIKVNGEVIEEALPFDPTGEWNNWQTTSTIAELKSGENIIIATGVGASGGANIDNLTIEKIYDKTYEAEDAELEGVIIDTKHTGYTGTGFTDYNPNSPGGTITWKINVPTEGDYALSFRYGHGGSDERPAEIKVNGDVQIESLAFDPTGEWNNWQNTSGIVHLKSGENEIVATGIGVSGGANIDSMRVCTPSLISSENEEKIVMNTVDIDEIVDPVLSQKLVESNIITYDEVEPHYTENENVKIESVDVVSSNIVTVTLDSYIEEFNPYDIMLEASTTAWESLNPNFKYLQVRGVATTQNGEGNTVIIYQLTDALNDNGGVDIEEETKAFSGDIEVAHKKALNMVSWQLESGGWYKNDDSVYNEPWDGESKRAEWFGPNGEELATIDNDATISEMRYIAEVYRETGDPILKASFESGLDFLFKLQYETGGFAQVYPRRGTDEAPSYSDFVTFNDNAMINVLNFYDDILERSYPFDAMELSDSYYNKIEESKENAIDYILKAQIEVDGKLTAWCAQHDSYNYEPQYARAYEHPSISGMESAGIIKYLMSLEQTPEIENAVNSALDWYELAKVSDTRYASGDPENIYFYESPGNDMWYRFYDVETNEPIFSGRDGIVRHDLLEVEEERRNGYSWAGDYASSLLKTANSYGFYEDKIYAEVVNNKSADSNGKTLVVGEYDSSNYLVPEMSQEEVIITVDSDGTGDFTTVQEAIDFVPENNVYPVTIEIADGVYKEVLNIPKTKSNITLVGESPENTIITYDNYAGKDNGVGGTIGTSGSSSVYIYPDDFKAKNITFENSFDESAYNGDGTQAVAVYVKGDRQIFENCRFIGNQDTLYVNDGSQYFKDCYIEGDVDFIFGASSAVFDNCQIHSLDKGSEDNNGYVTAASTSINDEYGLLFTNCIFTSDAKEGTVYLGRPWHPSGDVNAIASVAFIDCEIGDHINEDGYTSMSGFEPEGHRFYEYNNSGLGGVVHNRGTELNEITASYYTIEEVLGWSPEDYK